MIVPVGLLLSIVVAPAFGVSAVGAIETRVSTLVQGRLSRRLHKSRQLAAVAGG